MNETNSFFQELATYDADQILNSLNVHYDVDEPDQPSQTNFSKELTEEDLLPEENLHNDVSMNLVQTIRNRFTKENSKKFSIKRREKPKKEQKIYTLSEVFRHNQENDCWIVIGDNVYDVTNYLNTHPGGDIIIMERAGMDATRVFLDQNHSSAAKVLLEKYLIGKVDLLKDRDTINKLRPEDPEEFRLFPFLFAIFVLSGLIYLYFQNN